LDESKILFNDGVTKYLGTFMLHKYGTLQKNYKKKMCPCSYHGALASASKHEVVMVNSIEQHRLGIITQI
jgi:hypothetical protein